MRRKAFLFTFLVLSLLLAACVRSGGTEGENSYTIYYPAAELRDVPGEDAIVARTVQLPDADTLAQGPESGALAALLPEEFTVLSARVEEGTCYLNLPSDADLGISPRQTVESLVLSLCSLDTVERVQIVVDGEIAAQLNGVNVGEPLTP